MGFEPAGVAPQVVVLSSKVLQKPVSRLAYLNNSSELLHFPNTAGLERVAGSQVRPEHVDRNLAGLWLQHNHALARQVRGGWVVWVLRVWGEGVRWIGTWHLAAAQPHAG